MTGRALLIAGLAGLAGCEGGGPLTSRHTMAGSLKASVSQLEFQNDELQRQVADLKSENRRFEDRLVQERAENERLASQLDSARGQLGLDSADTRTGSRTQAGTDEESGGESLPKARPSRSKRKPPAASIPGRIEPSRVDPEDDLSSIEPSPARGRLASRRALDNRWLPVARGTGSGQGAIK